MPLPSRESLGRYTAKTYLWMFAGLGVTFLVAVAPRGHRPHGAAGSHGAGRHGASLSRSWWLLSSFPRGSKKISAGGERPPCSFSMPLSRALLFALIFLTYEVTSAIAIFGVTALVSASWAPGAISPSRIFRAGARCFFGLIGLLLVTIVNLFMNNSTMEIILSYVGVILFLAYTAYDTQKIKAYYFSFQGDTAMLKKASIISALQLYLISSTSSSICCAYSATGKLNEFEKGTGKAGSLFVHKIELVSPI